MTAAGLVPLRALSALEPVFQLTPTSGARANSPSPSGPLHSA